jgi:hypothetical protein
MQGKHNRFNGELPCILHGFNLGYNHFNDSISGLHITHGLNRGFLEKDVFLG